MRVPHLYPARCAADCPEMILTGLLLCPGCWSRVSAATKACVHQTLNAWKNGGSLTDYKSARSLAVQEAGRRIAA